MIARPIHRSIASGSDRGLPVAADSVLLATIHDIATLDSSITTSAGAPTPQWTVIESDGKVYNYTGTSISHTRQTAGDMTLRLGPASLGPYVKELDYRGDPSTGGLKTILTSADLAKLSALELIDVSQNTATGGGVSADVTEFPATLIQARLNAQSGVITGDMSDLPPNIEYWATNDSPSTFGGALADAPDSLVGSLGVGNTQGVLTGSLADLPANLTTFYAHKTNSTISGSLSDLPDSMRRLVVFDSDCIVTGGATAMLATAIRDIQINDLSLNQAQVDSVIDRIYADRALFTDAAPELNISGNNAAPSGTYQYAASPSTGLEKIYALENDDDAEGFNTWTITYTAP